jgi:hypothetical protein
MVFLGGMLSRLPFQAIFSSLTAALELPEALYATNRY